MQRPLNNRYRKTSGTRYGLVNYGKPRDPARYTSYRSRSGKIYKMRSGWEVKFAAHLDAKGIEWEYETRTYAIDFILDGHRRTGTYTPDFYIPSTGDHYEVKGRWFPESRAKWDAFLIKYPNIQIHLMDQRQLKSLGII